MSPCPSRATIIRNVVIQCFHLNKCDINNNKDLIDNVKYQVIDLLFAYGYSEENVSMITGSALKALVGKKEYIEKIIELTNKVNEVTPNNKKLIKSKK